MGEVEEMMERRSEESKKGRVQRGEGGDMKTEEEKRKRGGGMNLRTGREDERIGGDETRGSGGRKKMAKGDGRQEVQTGEERRGEV